MADFEKYTAKFHFLEANFFTVMLKILIKVGFSLCFSVFFQSGHNFLSIVLDHGIHNFIFDFDDFIFYLGFFISIRL
jgi:hypothetical protein